ncbi:MAG TPA: CRISPR-associated endonuclease Cas3'', partial [Dehalococcoidia bacterium]|nr:CRISPR-associated endonuclease Cas3'' [Dehalococcoidia bacterium]
MIARLLAKSSRTPDAPQHFETLPGHLELVALAARRMTRDRGQQILAALGLGGGYEAALTEATVLAALLHDIGKANEDFQRMVRAPRPIAQALRHEIVGLWLLRQQAALAEWVFSDLAPDLRDVVLRAVVSHHLKFHSINSVQPRPAGRPRLRVLAGHYDFRAVLDVIRRECALGPAPDLSDLEVVLSGPLSELNEYLSEQGARWPEGDSELKAFHAAVSALLIAADVCGSALSRDGRAPD